MASTDHLEGLLSELDARNRDNVARTESYLELYAHTRAEPPDLPWLLLAHFVSRNAGYMMTGLRAALDDPKTAFRREAVEELFLFLERANFLIFHDAWHHVLMHRLGRSAALSPARTPRFVREAYARYEDRAADEDAERRLVRDLVVNEQSYIEHRVVHHPRYGTARALVAFFEAVGAERTMRFGTLDSGIAVGRFAELKRRIDTGWRLFDQILHDRARREELYQWARRHPHTGSRSDYGGKPGPTLGSAWPADAVRELQPTIHEPPAPDPAWP